MKKSIFLSLSVSLAASFLVNCSDSSSTDESRSSQGDSSSSEIGSSSSLENISSSSEETAGTFADARDSIVYKWVKIGNQIWMAENLNYSEEGNIGSCYANQDLNCKGLGRLYSWSTAMNISDVYDSTTYEILVKYEGICPDGWHVPTRLEWEELKTYLETDSGKKLKSKTGWKDSGNGTDDYNFAALPGGVMAKIGIYERAEQEGYWWSITQEPSSLGDYYRNAYAVKLDYSSNDLSSIPIQKTNGLSVRCIKN